MLYEVITKANIKPGLPVALSPVSGSEVASATPELVFNNAVDEDGDTLTYQAKVLSGEIKVAEYLDVPSGAGSTSVTVKTTLQENAQYQWAVQSYDGEDVSGWTTLQSFYVNALDERNNFV